MFLLKGEKSNYGINLPTSLEELNEEVFNEILKNIEIPKHYCVIALCQKMRLFDIGVMVDGKSDATISAVPVIAKLPVEGFTSITAAVGNRAIIGRSAIEMGTHLNVNVCIEHGKVMAYIKENPELKKNIVTGRLANPKLIGDLNKTLAGSNSPHVYTIAFKIVPESDLRGCIKVGQNVNDIFKASGLAN